MSIDTRVIANNGYAFRTQVDGTYADVLTVDNGAVGISGAIQIDNTSALSTSYPHMLISNHNNVKGEAIAILTFQAGDYSPPIPEQIGQPLANDFAYDTGTLLSYNNSTRVWLVQIEELDYFNRSMIVAVPGGGNSGSGTTVGPAVISRVFNRASLELAAGNNAVSGYIQAEYEDIRITDDVISSQKEIGQYGRSNSFPPYIDGQVRINTDGDYPLILGSDASDFMTISKGLVEVHETGPVTFKIANHTETVGVNFDASVGPIGGFTYQINTPQDYGHGPLPFAEMKVDVRVTEDYDLNFPAQYNGIINLDVKTYSNALWTNNIFADVTSNFVAPIYGIDTYIYGSSNPAMSILGNWVTFDEPAPLPITFNLQSFFHQNFIGVNTNNPKRSLHVDQSSFLGDMGQFPSALTSNSSPGQGTAAMYLSFSASDYTNAVPGHIGQTVYTSDIYSNGILLSYNNTSRIWVVHVEEVDYFNDAIGSEIYAYYIASAAGGTLQAINISQEFNRANFEVSAGNGAVSGYFQAEYEDTNLTDDVSISLDTPSDYTNGQVRINTRGDYPLILGSDSSDMLSISKNGIEAHQHQDVNVTIARHSFDSDPLAPYESFPLGEIAFKAPAVYAYGGIQKYANIVVSSITETGVWGGRIDFIVVETDLSKSNGLADTSAALSVLAVHNPEDINYIPPNILARGRVGVNISALPTKSPLTVEALGAYNNNSDAINIGGLSVGDFYKDNGNPARVCVVF